MKGGEEKAYTLNDMLDLIRENKITTLRLRKELLEKELTYYDVAGRLMYHPVIIKVCEALKDNTSITVMYFSDCHVTNAEATAISEMLEKNRTIAGLYFGNNKIGDEGVISIARALESNQGIKMLFFPASQIGDKGAIAFAQMLEKNKRIQGVYLQSNKISNRGARALAIALKESACRTLDLSRNLEITETSAGAFLTLLKGNSFLNELNLNNTQLAKSKVLSQMIIAERNLPYEFKDLSKTSYFRGLSIVRIKREESHVNNDDWADTSASTSGASSKKWKGKEKENDDESSLLAIPDEAGRSTLQRSEEKKAIASLQAKVTALETALASAEKSAAEAESAAAHSVEAARSEPPVADSVGGEEEKEVIANLQAKVTALETALASAEKRAAESAAAHSVEAARSGPQPPKKSLIFFAQDIYAEASVWSNNLQTHRVLPASSRDRPVLN